MLTYGTTDGAAAAEPNTASGVLVRLPTLKVLSESPEAPAALADANEMISDLGFGWVFVEGDPTDPAVQAVVDSLGGTPAPNTIYELLEDPLFPEQWALNNTGQLGGTPDADIDAPEAWAISEGDASVVVAVLDTGVDLDHADLVDRLWTNTGEIPGNLIDDDGNGFVDDVNGWDFYGTDVDADGNPIPDNYPDDETWHGTSVSGAVAATKNTVGIVGVAPGVTIMPVRVCYYDCPLAMIVEGINYAISNGANIINMSFGVGTFDQPLADAVAASSSADIVVVAAAGNSGADNDATPMYPANLTSPNVISVAATDRDDRLVIPADSLGWSSNIGAATVDLAAPGRDIKLATNTGGWKTASGTSFASPIVAGAAALVRSVLPGASATTVKQILLDTVDPLDSLTGKTLTGGRLNAAAATALAANQPPVAVASGAPVIGTVPFTVSLDGTESSDDRGITTWDWTGGPQPVSGETTTLEFTTPGIYAVTLTVTDTDGATDTDTITITAAEPPNVPPTANASVAPTSGTAPLTISLDGALSSDSDGTITDWDWTGGTQSATGETASMTITAPGTYTVTLTVTDNEGATDTATKTVTVTETEEPIPPVSVERVAGSDRYATSALLSADTTDPGVPVVYVATGVAFPDGLVAAAAAGQSGGSMLLVRPDAVPGSIAAELTRLKPQSIVIAGGTAAISPNVETALAQYASSVVRLAGANRYDTAALVSKAAFPTGADIVYVTTGESFPDTMSSVPAAATTNGPVLLLRSTSIPSATRAELKRLNPSKIVVVGGPAAIDSALDAQLAAITGATVERRYGSDRYATSAAISQATFGPRVPVVYIATGINFPDGLGGAAAGAIEGGPLLLPKPDSLPATIAAELRRLKPQRVVIVGGTAAITSDVQSQISDTVSTP
jgi:subtilisin family serine protease/putative cell wall-binding protein